MCGIAGLLRTTQPVSPEDVFAVQRMLGAQRHRGPDGERVVACGNVAAGVRERLTSRDCRVNQIMTDAVVLGHRRLAIIDLSEAGRQPMANEEETVWITYNGEIYNFAELRVTLRQCGHQFRSQADSEVLLHGYEEWGIEGILERLRGMFAFALYDARSGSTPVASPRSGRLILARDRLGIKPLYYWQSLNGADLAFASEVKALRRSGVVSQEQDRDALCGFLLFGSVPSPYTILKGVQSLLPGHYLSVDAKGTDLHQYWDLPREEDVYTTTSSQRAVEDVATLLEPTVTKHLVSDVPVGLFLSGGLDSGGLVRLASAKHDRHVRTLTVGFDDAPGDETQAARDVADFYRTEHTEVRIRAEDFWEALPSVFTAMDQPTNDGVNTYFVARAAREAGLTVALSGAGGDEVFLGYSHYHWLTRRYGLASLYARLPEHVRVLVSRSACRYGRWRGEERWQRFAYLQHALGPSAYYLLIRGFFAPSQIERLLGVSLSAQQTLAETILEPTQSGQQRPMSVHAFNRVEIQRYLHDQLLRDIDVFGMAHSIEVRVPYLDHTVVEHALRIPIGQKIQHGINKPLLANSVYEPLVESLSGVRVQNKRGFSLPMDTWMRRYANALEEMALQADGLDRDSVRNLWQEFRNQRLHWSRAWALTVLGMRQTQ